MSEPTYRLASALAAVKAAMDTVTGAGKYFRYCGRGPLVFPLAAGIPTPAVSVYLKPGQTLRREGIVWVAEVALDIAFDTGKDADSEFIVATASAWTAVASLPIDRPAFDLAIIALGEGRFARSGAAGTLRMRIEDPLVSSG